jgi:hypothetical protein
MAYAIKAKVANPRATTFTFTAQKTMYGGKLIAEGDTIFVFASENEGGQGLIEEQRAVAPNSPETKIENDDGRCTIRSRRFTEIRNACLRRKGFGEFEGA